MNTVLVSGPNDGRLHQHIAGVEGYIIIEIIHGASTKELYIRFLEEKVLPLLMCTMKTISLGNMPCRVTISTIDRVDQ